MDNITFALDGKIRSIKPHEDYLSDISEMARAIDPSLGAIITSGGQASHPMLGPRTGSTRHDVDEEGHAYTSDFALTRDGKAFLPGDDPDTYSKFIESAATKYPGIGHYDWGIHVGGGKEAFWGPDKTSATADSTFAEAFQRGRSRAGQPLVRPVEPKNPLVSALVSQARKHGYDPLDIATIISYETAGTFDPWKKGPTTQWGEHRGLIQWGEPQRKQYGITQDMPVEAQMEAVFKYLNDRGAPPGSDILSMYAAINGGHASKTEVTDENNGGAPGTVREKVENQFADHVKNARRMLAGEIDPSGSSSASKRTVSSYASTQSSNIELPSFPEAPVQLPDAPETEAPSLWQLTKDAANVEQTLPWMLSGVSGRPQSDPSWSLEESRVKADLSTMNSNLTKAADYLGDATSEADYTQRLDDLYQNNKRIERLSEAGMTGTALRVANAILDPVSLTAEIGAVALTGGSAGPLVAANKVNRARRIASAAASGAIGGFAAEGVAVATNINRDKMDLLYGTVLGAGVGSVAGTLMTRSSTQEAGEMLQRASQAAQDDYLNRVVGSGPRQTSEDQFFADKEMLKLLNAEDLDDASMLSGRFSLSAELQKSKNPITRALSGLVQDGVGKKNGAVNSIAPSEDQDRLFNEFMAGANRVFKPALRDFKKETGMKGEDAYLKMNEDVDAYIRDRSVDRAEKYPASVVRLGNRLSSMNKEWLHLAQNPFKREGMEGRSVRGFDQVAESENYLGRHYDPVKIAKVHHGYEEGTLSRWFSGAIRSALPELEEKVIERLGKRMSNGVVKNSLGVQESMFRPMTAETLEDLLTELKIDGDDAANLKAALIQPEGKAGRDAYAKRRQLLDESWTLKDAKLKDGKVKEDGLRLQDLIVTDAMQNYSRYGRSMSGMVALARFRFKDPETGEVLINGITSDTEFENLLRLVNDQGIEKGIAPNLIEKDLEALRYAYDTIRGRPTHKGENQRWGRYARRLRKLNFVRVMNQVGLAQIPEAGRAISHLGFRAAFSQVPALRRALTAEGEVVLKNPLMDELELATGIGTDRLSHQLDYRFDDLSGAFETSDGSSAGQRFEDILNKASRVTSEASGMTQINIMLQRWTAASIVQKFANMAAKGGKGMTSQRLADLGLDPEMSDRIMKQMSSDNVTYDQSLLGKKVAQLNLAKWDDKEAAEAFRTTLVRYTNQIIQRNDIGNLPRVLGHPVAKMIFQFRTFMLASYEKMLLNNIKNKDATAALEIMMTTAMAGAVYTAQVKAKALGRSDREEYEDRYLSPEKVAAAAFARSGMSSIIPTLVDTGAIMTGNDGVFSHTRTSGQVSDLFFGNPSGGLIEQIAEVSSDTMKGDGFSQEEARAVARLAPFGNALPIVIALDTLIRDLPERQPK